MPSRPLLSIVIPTRNRSKYAASAIRNILEISDPALELVVHDNSDTRELAIYVDEHFADPRLRYRYVGIPLSLIDNFSAALELASGEYLCMIGDDDGVNPEIVDAARWAQRERLDSLAIRSVANYLWEGTGVPSTFFTEVVGSSLTIADFRGSVRPTTPNEEIVKLMRQGGVYYLDYDLPKLYHGLVHRSRMWEIKEKTGAFFGGLSPDIFASLAIACVAKRVMVTEYPLTIPGASKTSGSVIEGGLRQHSKKLEDAHHLRGRQGYEWSELVPRVYTPETIWADSGIAALRAMGREDLVSELNIPKLGAFCVAANRGVTHIVLREVLKASRVQGTSSVSALLAFAVSMITGPGVKFARRVWNRLLLMSRVRVIRRIEGLENIVAASHALTDVLSTNGLKFSPLSIREHQISALPRS